MEEPEKVSVINEKPVIKVKKTKSVGYIFIILVLLAAGAGAFYWRDKEAKDQSAADKNKIAQLENQIAALQQSAANNAEEDEDAQSAQTLPTQETKDNIAAAITSDNTAALEGYMAPTVTVILAASEGIGERTPTEAIGDLVYLDGATTPWDFSLDDATLAAYGSGDYKNYFSSNSVVGKSANGYVVSFNFNGSGKINGIFMTNSSELL